MEVKDRLQKVFQDVFDDTGIIIGNEMTANDIETWDSLSNIQLVVAVEKEFQVKFKTGEIIMLKNVGEMIALVGKKLKS